jgi:hypothetical protein
MSAEAPPVGLTRSFRRTRAAWALGALVLLLATALAPLPPPGGSLLPTCGFRSLTGLPCALCGGTRSAQAVLRGDFARARTLNPLAFPAVGLIVVIGLIAGIEAWRGRAMSPWTQSWQKRGTLLILAGLLGLLIWWPPHLTRALRENNTDLIDPTHPVTRALQQRLVPTEH